MGWNRGGGGERLLTVPPKCTGPTLGQIAPVILEGLSCKRKEHTRYLTEALQSGSESVRQHVLRALLCALRTFASK